jgi:hypothetical protein
VPARTRPSTVTGRYAAVRQHILDRSARDKNRQIRAAVEACTAALLSASSVIACPPICPERSYEIRPRYGLNHNAAFSPYYPAVAGGGAGTCLPAPPPLTDLKPPPPLASFAGSKSRTSFSRSLSVLETSSFSFIFRLSFCCCEPDLNRPCAWSLNFYNHGAGNTIKKSRARSNTSTPMNSLRPRRNHRARAKAFWTRLRANA